MIFLEQFRVINNTSQNYIDSFTFDNITILLCKL